MQKGINDFNNKRCGLNFIFKRHSGLPIGNCHHIYYARVSEAKSDDATNTTVLF